MEQITERDLARLPAIALAQQITHVVSGLGLFESSLDYKKHAKPFSDHLGYGLLSVVSGFALFVAKEIDLPFFPSRSDLFGLFSERRGAEPTRDLNHIFHLYPRHNPATK